jgi:hypothetical protein
MHVKKKINRPKMQIRKGSAGIDAISIFCTGKKILVASRRFGATGVT